MKLVILVLVLTAVWSTSFEEYMVQFNRTYQGEEKEARREIFNRNLELIEKAKRQNSSYVMGLTRWSDHFDHEVSNGMNLKYKKESSLTNKTSHKKLKIGQSLSNENSSQQIIEINYWDWREKGAVTQIRQQGMCGACWAFASTAIIESDFYIKTNVILDLSEEYIVECVGNDNDCGGGYFEDAYVFLKKKGGLPLESRYPYKAGALSKLVPTTADICNTSKLVEFKKKDDGQMDYDISYYDNVTNQQLEMILFQSPVSTHFASNARFVQYKSGIFECGEQAVKQQNINHGIQIVGFNSTGRYFIIKNSWGVRWGMNGFGYVSYDGDCGMRIRVFTFEQNLPLKMPDEAGEHNLQYEPLPFQVENYEPLPKERIAIESVSFEPKIVLPMLLLISLYFYI